MKKTLSLLLSLVLMLSLALPASAAETEYPTLEGGVTEIQKYGNIVLDIDPADLKDGGYTYGDLLTVTVNGTGYDMPLCTNYSDVDTGSLMLRDSEGVLIAAINMGDFATSNGLAAKVTAEDGSYTWEFPEGQSLESITVSISMKEQGGYYDQYLIHQLTRTDERADYASDAVFGDDARVCQRRHGGGRNQGDVGFVLGKGLDCFGGVGQQQSGAEIIFVLDTIDEWRRAEARHDGYTWNYDHHP